MAKYRTDLPNGKGQYFLLDGGSETTFVFHDGIDLPCFAAYTMLADAAGRKRIRDYYRQYATLAINAGTGFILESIGWRANRDWGAQLGHNQADLDVFNRESIRLQQTIRAELETTATPMVISGCVGPRGDGYQADTAMSVAESADYHMAQVATYAQTEVDMVTAMTMTNAEEAAGIVVAASKMGMPSVIAFTVETDGRLPTGQTLKDAIAFVDDQAATKAHYFMINCAHPDHFDDILEPGADWMNRLKGIRANASRMSHEELDAMTELDDGNPEEFGMLHRSITERFPNFTVLGGCCGTDHRHIGQVAQHCCTKKRQAA